MVAAIKTPHSIKRCLNYNERKVQQGRAELIHAGNFLKEPQEMNFYQKLERFEKQMELNQRAQTKTLHVSINFDPSEKDKLTKERLTEIADEYMKRCGFGKQPYLVYVHYDSGHPHIHVVTTLIQENGKRIDTHRFGQDVSGPVTRQLEIEYELVKAKKREHKLEHEMEMLRQPGGRAQKIEYGKSETRRSITNVLDVVVDHYKYTSLAELNAVLGLYNVMADRGTEDSRTYKNKGLHYRVLDANGQKVGVPIKASSIYSKPTLKCLEGKFKENELKREPDMKRLKNTIDLAMLKQPKRMDELIKHLQKERVSVVLRRSAEGKVYGMTYVDHQAKTVFNGSDLGKEYSARRILERLGIDQNKERVPELRLALEKTDPDKELSPTANILLTGIAKAIEQTVQPEETNEQLANELREELKKKKKQKNLSREL